MKKAQQHQTRIYSVNAYYASTSCQVLCKALGIQWWTRQTWSPLMKGWIAEHIKKPSGGFLKCLCTAPPAWVSLKLAVTVSWAQEGPGGRTSDSLICKHQEAWELWTTTEGCQLYWAHPCPHPATASPAIPPYRHRLMDRNGPRKPVEMISRSFSLARPSRVAKFSK